MPRMKGRQYRQAKPQPQAVRHDQVRDALRAGQHDPAVIAKALGCSKELVLYHARRMTDVELRQVRPEGGRRWRHLIYFITAQDVAA